MELNYMEAGKQMSEHDVSEALDLCQQIVNEAEDLPEEAEDFAASVTDTAYSIQEWVTDNDKVTPKQMKALRNMLKGISKWQQ